MSTLAQTAATLPAGPWLVADIGGTNARFGWVEVPGGEVLAAASLPVAAHAGPLAAARAYLAARAAELGPRYRAPRAAAWAVATAVVDDRVELTNAGWTFSRRELQRELGLDVLRIVNDFEALALSLPQLVPAQIRAVGPACGPVDGGRAPAAMAVIGPGTGLGVAGLVPLPADERRGALPGWLAVPGEGGHASLAAADDFESELLGVVRRQHAHVSAERLLSGIGLPVLHQALATLQARAAPPLRAETIVARGVAEPGTPEADGLCRQALEHFCALLGGFAGNVALTLGARGGVYVGGGIVPRLGELFYGSRFRERFVAKGRFEAYLQAIPTRVIVDTRVALGGAALALRQHGAA